MPQSLTKRDTAVIKRAQQKRRSVLHLRQDGDWLTEFTQNPRLLLSRMAQRGALVPLGGGRYAIPSLGDPTPARLPQLNLLHADLDPLGAYYVGFWSALALHRLTDVDARELTVAIAFSNSRLESNRSEIAGARVRVTRVPKDLMTFGVETVRLSRTERYVRSDPERTLIDCLMRPRLAGSVELTMTAWGRALAHDTLRIDALVDYATRLGPRAWRRVGAVLTAAGRGELIAERFPQVTPRARPLTLGTDPEGPDIDTRYRVALTPSRERLEGWLSYGK
jgi:predicted transcriptional regulator of viral defense system